MVKTVGSYWPYATTLFDFVRRAMPWTAPKSLSDDEVYAVSAYVLRLNNIIGDNDVMDAKTLAAGQNAEPGRLHSALPGQALARGPERDAGFGRRPPPAPFHRCGIARRYAPRQPRLHGPALTPKGGRAVFC